MKQVVVPLLLFVVSAFLSLSAIQMAYVSFLVGAAISILALARSKRAAISDNKRNSSSTLLISGAVLMIAPILTVLLVMAGMSGLFSKL